MGYNCPKYIDTVVDKEISLNGIDITQVTIFEVLQLFSLPEEEYHCLTLSWKISSTRISHLHM